jgi:hypothetical protein
MLLDIQSDILFIQKKARAATCETLRLEFHTHPTSSVVSTCLARLCPPAQILGKRIPTQALSHRPPRIRISSLHDDIAANQVLPYLTPPALGLLQPDSTTVGLLLPQAIWMIFNTG